MNRPFDEQTDDRIRIEAESVLVILNNANFKNIELIGSDAILFEINKTPDSVRKSRMLSLTDHFSKNVKFDESIKMRAKNLQKLGFKGYDAFHLACAEKGKASVLLTTDDKFIKLSKRHEKEIDVKVTNPFQWIQGNLLK